MPDTPAPTRLPAPFADSTGALDVDGLRTLAGGLRLELIDALRSSVRAIREARGTVVVPEDTHDAVRRLVDAGEVLRRMADVFTTAAKEADALAEEELITVHGVDEGVPRASLFVPDGEGQRIALRADWKSGDSAWDVPSLVGWLIEDEVADYKAGDPLQTALRQSGTSAPMMWDDDQVREVVRSTIDRLLALGKFTPSATAIKALRTRLSERGRDKDAGIIAGVRSVGPRTYLGVKITREPTPASQR